MSNLLHLQLIATFKHIRKHIIYIFTNCSGSYLNPLFGNSQQPQVKVDLHAAHCAHIKIRYNMLIVTYSNKRVSVETVLLIIPA